MKTKLSNSWSVSPAIYSVVQKSLQKMDSKMKAFCDLSIGVVIIKFILGKCFLKVSVETFMAVAGNTE